MAGVDLGTANRALGLEVKGLSRTYRLSSEDLLVLDHVDFSVQPGEFLSLIGPSGCGKTTLLRILGGLLAPSEGTVRFDPGDVVPLNGSRTMSYVPQDLGLLPWRTVLGNVDLPLELGAEPSPWWSSSAELLDYFGLKGFHDVYPHQLSAGMQRRVALARALRFSSGLVLLDEPLANLDELTRRSLRSELSRVHVASGATVILVTHSIEEAIFLADKVIILSPRPARVLDSVTIPFTRPREPSLEREVDFQRLVQYLMSRLEVGV